MLRSLELGLEFLVRSYWTYLLNCKTNVKAEERNSGCTLHKQHWRRETIVNPLKFLGGNNHFSK